MRLCVRIFVKSPCNRKRLTFRMAPFKLKFRMGSSRSTSQEVDADPQVNQSLLNNYNTVGFGTSNSTLDSADCSSLGSLGGNDRRSLLPNSKEERLGYLNPVISKSTDSTVSSRDQSPTYESISQKKKADLLPSSTTLTKLIEKKENKKHQQPTTEVNVEKSHKRNVGSGAKMTDYSGNSASHIQSNCSLNSSTSMENVSTITCTDPDCNVGAGGGTSTAASPITRTTSTSSSTCQDHTNDCRQERENENRKRSVDSSECLLSTTTMTATTLSPPQSHENLLECSSESCDPLLENHHLIHQHNNEQSRMHQNDCDDECQHHHQNCSDDDCHQSSNIIYRTGSNFNIDNDGDGGGNSSDEVDNVGNNNYICTSDDGGDYSSIIWDQQQHQQHQQQQQHQQESFEQEQQNQRQQQRLPIYLPELTTSEIISNKSSKKIYKAVAKQWGITCKMSEQCRCMECQSNYFDCEFDENEHQKTDGGLGAGTPMFISEVMHGSACIIL